MNWYKKSQSDRKKCQECHGDKRIYKKLKNHGTGQYDAHLISCPTCSGKGYTDEKDREAYMHGMGLAPCPWDHDQTSSSLSLRKIAQITNISEIQVGDELLYNYPVAPYKGSARIEKINPDGTVDVLDHSGRYMRGLSLMFGSDPMFKGKKDELV